MERPHAHALRFSMAARANVVVYDRLLAVVLCVLATCSCRGDTVVSKELVWEARGAGVSGERRCDVCGRVVELVRGADEAGVRRAGCMLHSSRNHAGVHPSLVSTRVTGYTIRTGLTSRPSHNPTHTSSRHALSHRGPRISHLPSCTPRPDGTTLWAPTGPHSAPPRRPSVP